MVEFDVVRRFIRKILGWDSQMYRRLSQVHEFAEVFVREGLKTWLLLHKCASGSLTSPISLKLKGLRFPILIRPGTSDTKTVLNNIIRREYGQVAPPCKPRWMIDAGAYIGDTAAYFLSKYPCLRVIVLEPNSTNFLMAEKNLLPYGARAILLKQGLWGTDKFGVPTKMHFQGGGTGGWVGDSGSGDEIECVSIETLIRRYPIPKIDILKIDIEGAEKNVFLSDPDKWLPLVSLLIIEIHGPEQLVAIRKALERNGFSMRQYRSVWYCLPNN